MKPIEKLLQRLPPPSYQEEWTQLLEKAYQEEQSQHTASLVVFRLANELLALPTNSFATILEKKPYHSLPTLNNPYIQGVVNINGQLKVLVDLHLLLKLPGESRANHEKSKLIVLSNESDVWCSFVDEIFGIYTIEPSNCQNVPVNLKENPNCVLKAIIPWEESTYVGWMDELMLFQSLRGEC